MEGMASPDTAPESVEYQRVVDEYITNIQALLDTMRQDQTDMARLRAESRAHQSETDRLIAETRAVLASLRTTV
jgi:hypothetical protein